MIAFGIESILKLKAYAHAHIFTWEHLKKIVNNELPPAGEDCNFVIGIFNMRIVFSIEEQPCGLCQHISISSYKNRVNSALLNLVLAEFGFNQNDKRMVWNENNALNIVELINKRGKNEKKTTNQRRAANRSGKKVHRTQKN